MVKEGFDEKSDYYKSDIEWVLENIQNNFTFDILNNEFDSVKDTFFVLFNQYEKLNGKQILDIVQILCELNEVIEEIGLAIAPDEFNETKLFLSSIYINDKLKLNKDQTEAILREDNTLKVNAGAGTGKTTTLAAKVKYLMEVKNVNASKILCLTFSRECAKDLRHKLYDFLLGSEFSFEKRVMVYDFPNFGLELLKKKGLRVKRFSEENFEHLKSRKLLKEFIINEIGEDNDNIIIFEKFKWYFPLVFNLGFQRPKNWRDNIKVKNKGEYNFNIGTFQYRPAYGERELVKSFYDLRIADFLFRNNVKYEFLKEYPYKDKTVEFDFYLPGSNVYIEYFRLDGHNNYHNLTDDEIDEFNEQLKIKRAISNETGANIIFIDSYENINDLLSILSNELGKYDVVLEEKNLTTNDIRHCLDRNKFLEHLKKVSDYFYDFIRLYKEHDFKKQITDFSGKEGREIFFLDMVSQYYDYYQNELKNDGKRDFSDMITESTKLIKDFSETDVDKYINYDYILVDEYQDISKIRFNLLCELQKKSGAKLIVFGDCCQSIYSFSGSEVKYFSNFEKDYFPNAKQLPLYQSYRCCQDLLDISSKFVSKEDKLFKKLDLFSKKHLKQPLEFWTYSVEDDQYIIVYEILNHISKEFPSSSVMILSRYRNQRNKIRRKLKYINADKLFGLTIDYRTIHESKGLESDNVIILDVNRRSIPIQVNEESLLRFVSSNDPYEKRKEREKCDERKLFYVALTRARNKVYLTIYDEKKSKYIKELDEISDSISWMEYKHNPCFNPLRVRNKETIKHFWDCKKELSKSNQICPECKEGYLIHYEINKKHYVVCSEFNKTCDYFIDDPIELSVDDFYLEECDHCHNGLTYYNTLYNYSEEKKRLCTYGPCRYNKKKILRKVELSQNIDSSQSKIFDF